MARPKGTTKDNNRRPITIRVTQATYDKLTELRKGGFNLGRWLDENL